MRRLLTAAGGLALAIALFADIAGAGVLSSDVNGISAYRGSMRFISYLVGKIDFVADVDYCVYAPGQFNKSFSGKDPSDGQRYVYTYQIFNEANPYPSGAIWLNTKGYVNKFTLGLVFGDEYVKDVTWIAGYGGREPASTTLAPSSALWNFVGTGYQINYKNPPAGDSHSTILIMTSSVGPGMENASTVSGRGGKTEILPTPAPEPASLAMLGTGLLLCLARRQRRQ